MLDTYKGLSLDIKWMAASTVRSRTRVSALLVATPSSGLMPIAKVDASTMNELQWPQRPRARGASDGPWCTWWRAVTRLPPVLPIPRGAELQGKPVPLLLLLLGNKSSVRDAGVDRWIFVLVVK